MTGAEGNCGPSWVSAPSALAVASRAQSASGQSRILPATKPATMASPAPTVLLTSTSGGTASRLCAAVANKAPSRPIDTTTQPMPLSSKRRAAATTAA